MNKWRINRHRKSSNSGCPVWIRGVQPHTQPHWSSDLHVSTKPALNLMFQRFVISHVLQWNIVLFVYSVFSWSGQKQLKNYHSLPQKPTQYWKTKLRNVRAEFSTLRLWLCGVFLPGSPWLANRLMQAGHNVDAGPVVTLHKPSGILHCFGRVGADCSVTFANG